MGKGQRQNTREEMRKTESTHWGLSSAFLKKKIWVKRKGQSNINITTLENLCYYFLVKLSDGGNKDLSS